MSVHISSCRLQWKCEICCKWSCLCSITAEKIWYLKWTGLWMTVVYKYVIIYGAGPCWCINTSQLYNIYFMTADHENIQYPHSLYANTLCGLSQSHIFILTFQLLKCGTRAILWFSTATSLKPKGWIVQLLSLFETPISLWWEMCEGWLVWWNHFYHKFW